MEFGVYSFGDLPPEKRGADAARERIDALLATAKLADDAGLSIFGLGEHHRSDYAVSSPTTVLAAIAAITKKIRLTSAVTILSSDDPVRVFQEFATLDLISSGRAEMMAGRGAFIESFPLFGQKLEDYDLLFNEKLDLLLELRDHEKINWKGHFRAALQDAEIAPRPLNKDMPIWIAAGGTPESARRAGRLGLPLNLATIGGEPKQFIPFFNLYKETYHASGHPADKLQIAISSHFHIAPDSQTARSEFYPYYRRYMFHNLPNRDRGWDVSPATFDALASPHGALFVGSPQEIIDKIAYEKEIFGHHRYLAQLDIGGLPFPLVARSIELIATKVMPVVKNL